MRLGIVLVDRLRNINVYYYRYYWNVYSADSPRFAVDVVSNDGQFPTVHTAKGNELMVTGPLCRFSVDLIPLLRVMAGPHGTAKLRLDEHVDLRTLQYFSMGTDDRKMLASGLDPELRDAQLRVRWCFNPPFHGTKLTSKKDMLIIGWLIYLYLQCCVVTHYYCILKHYFSFYEAIIIKY